ncbi:MAG: putative lipid II flippase FtsW [candidate division Zixibacteria bacterium]|nr:putative lipid II flippase FtsW [candidate division Zixibacteria bacterium]
MDNRWGLDFFLLTVVLILLTVGVVMVYSSSHFIALKKFDTPHFFLLRQVVWSVIALGALLVLSRIDYHLFRRVARPLLVFGFLLLVLVLFSRPIKGAHRWISFKAFQFQPSEFFKFALAVYLAHSLAKRTGKLENWRYLLIPYAPILLLAFLLIMKEPDLGTFMTIAVMTFLGLFVVGARVKHLVLVTLPVVFLAAVFVFGLGYKKARVLDYARSFHDPSLGSYQVKQATLALGSGGLFGRGLGEGRQKMFYLPEPHTDFIFASIGEEGGLVGLLLLLFLFLVLIWRGWMVAARAPDLFGFLLGFVLTASIFVSVVLNLAVVTGLVPTTGIPLPFLSYGGSSLLMTAVSVGVLQNIAAQTRLFEAARPGKERRGRFA